MSLAWLIGNLKMDVHHENLLKQSVEGKQVTRETSVVSPAWAGHSFTRVDLLSSHYVDQVG